MAALMEFGFLIRGKTASSKKLTKDELTPRDRGGYAHTRHMYPYGVHAPPLSELTGKYEVDGRLDKSENGDFTMTVDHIQRKSAGHRRVSFNFDEKLVKKSAPVGGKSKNRQISPLRSVLSVHRKPRDKVSEVSRSADSALRFPCYNWNSTDNLKNKITMAPDKVYKNTYLENVNGVQTHSDLPVLSKKSRSTGDIYISRTLYAIAIDKERQKGKPGPAALRNPLMENYYKLSRQPVFEKRTMYGTGDQEKDPVTGNLYSHLQKSIDTLSPTPRDVDSQASSPATEQTTAVGRPLKREKVKYFPLPDTSVKTPPLTLQSSDKREYKSAELYKQYVESKLQNKPARTPTANRRFNSAASSNYGSSYAYFDDIINCNRPTTVRTMDLLSPMEENPKWEETSSTNNEEGANQGENKPASISVNHILDFPSPVNPETPEQTMAEKE